MKLSILIPTIERDKHSFDALMYNLYVQSSEARERDGGWAGIEVLANYSETDSIGVKRNELLSRARGEYVSFIDSDDRISHNYISLLLDGIIKGVDCCSLMGIYSVDYVFQKPFLHYLGCKEYYETKHAFHRFPNHLNCIKSPIAKQFKFPEINHGEDTDWATQIHKSGLIKTQHEIAEVLYYYDKQTR